MKFLNTVSCARRIHRGVVYYYVCRESHTSLFRFFHTLGKRLQISGTGIIRLLHLPNSEQPWQFLGNDWGRRRCPIWCHNQRVESCRSASARVVEGVPILSASPHSVRRTPLGSLALTQQSPMFSSPPDRCSGCLLRRAVRISTTFRHG